jgi:DmsE family decaheme c-type cytochrome
MEKNGPFVFEHGDVTENCSNCHSPHGSVTRRLVNTTMPYLCLQCHPGPHQRLLSTDPREKAIFARRCTDCHTMIHGSDTPDRQGKGTLRR